MGLCVCVSVISAYVRTINVRALSMAPLLTACHFVCSNDHVKFFFFQVLEHRVKFR